MRVATRFRSEDPEIQDEYKMYEFDPRHDITVYELAVIVKNTHPGDEEISWLANETYQISRHFKCV